MWQELTRGFAENIVEWKDWGDVVTNIGKNTAKRILETLLKGLFSPLEDALQGLTKSFAKALTQGVGGVLGKVGLGGIPGLGGGKDKTSPVQLPTDLPPGANLNLDGKTTGSGGSGASGLLSSLGNVAGIVNAVAAVGSGIATGIQLAHIESDTGKIEVNTRQCKEQLVSLQGTLNTYLPAVRDNTFGVWGALVNGPLQKLLDVVAFGVVNVRNVSGGGNDPNAQSPDWTENLELQKKWNEQLTDAYNNTSHYVESVSNATTALNTQTTSLDNVTDSLDGLKVTTTSLSSGVVSLTDATSTLFDRLHKLNTEGINPGLTTQQALDQGAAASGLTADQVKLIIDGQFKAHPDWYPEGTQPSDIYQPSFTVRPLSDDPTQAAKDKAQRDALEQYRAGQISKDDYAKLVASAERQYQTTVNPPTPLGTQLGGDQNDWWRLYQDRQTLLSDAMKKYTDGVISLSELIGEQRDITARYNASLALVTTNITGAQAGGNYSVAPSVGGSIKSNLSQFSDDEIKSELDAYLRAAALGIEHHGPINFAYNGKTGTYDVTGVNDFSQRLQDIAKPNGTIKTLDRSLVGLNIQTGNFSDSLQQASTSIADVGSLDGTVSDVSSSLSGFGSQLQSTTESLGSLGETLSNQVGNLSSTLTAQVSPSLANLTSTIDEITTAGNHFVDGVEVWTGTLGEAKKQFPHASFQTTLPGESLDDAIRRIIHGGRSVAVAAAGGSAGYDPGGSYSSNPVTFDSARQTNINVYAVDASSRQIATGLVNSLREQNVAVL